LAGFGLDRDEQTQQPRSSVAVLREKKANISRRRFFLFPFCIGDRFTCVPANEPPVAALKPAEAAMRHSQAPVLIQVSRYQHGKGVKGVHSDVGGAT